jgi:uncharacterized protein (TIGR02145 family)
MKKYILLALCIFLSGCATSDIPEQKITIHETSLQQIVQRTKEPSAELIAEKKDFLCGQDKIKDADGNEYKTAYFDIDGGHDVAKDGQCWMTENLNVGTVVLDPDEMPSNNGVVEKWCPNHVEKEMDCYMGGGIVKNQCGPKPDILTNNPDFCDGNNEIPLYGGLYSLKEAFNYDTNSSEGICPNGWKIPKYQDWKILTENIRAGLSYEKFIENKPEWRGLDKWQQQVPVGEELRNGIFNGLPIIKKENLIMSPFSVSFLEGAGFTLLSPGNPGEEYELLETVDFTEPEIFSIRCIKKEEVN